MGEPGAADLEPLEELLAKAGDRPWTYTQDGQGALCYVRAAERTYPIVRDHVATTLLHENAALIVAAVNALPDLLARVKAKQELQAHLDGLAHAKGVALEARVKALQDAIRRIVVADDALAKLAGEIGDAYTSTQAKTYGHWTDEFDASVEAARSLLGAEEGEG